MGAKFEMNQTRSGRYVFVLKTAEGQILLTSEPYRRHAEALGGIPTVKRIALRPRGFERRAAAADQAYFVLASAEGRVVLGCGALCTSHAAMEEGIRTVLTEGPAAEIEDLNTA